ncbi:MAG: hypothetical protein M1832_003721 [Thelocarpon impressellum]|nr:MAG: hypothetical protein M1832_003721 [Thelocarpon impressellum]
MRVPHAHPGPFSLLATTLLLPAFIAASDIDCKHIRIQKKSFDLSALGGPHSVSHVVKEPPSISNTTFTVDICQPLKVPKKTPKEDTCPNFTRICSIERISNKADDSSTIAHVRPIAGNFDHGRPIDAQVTRLKTSASHGDAEKEGLRLEMHGGEYKKRKQKAVIEFLCDSEAEERRRLKPRREAIDADEDDDDDDDDDDDPVDENNRLKFISYGPVDDDAKEDVLRLEWTTKWACEGQTERDEGDSKGHWGFFTWFIIIAFLATAAYLIFGSWLNYNRYGARGWDLLPHGDTIRDVPYLLQDWTRRVVSTAQGGGSRGGYSAV